MRKLILTFAIVAVIVLIVLLSAACSAGPSAAPSNSALTLTLEELGKYNGQNGQRAYIAVDLVIYDVTDVPQWKNGMHNGFAAGQDVTEAVKFSPHGVSKLNGIPIAGNLK